MIACAAAGRAGKVVAGTNAAAKILNMAASLASGTISRVG